MEKGTIPRSTYDELRVKPTLHRSQSCPLNLKTEVYVMHDNKLCLERTWLSRERAAVLVERRTCPHGTWTDVAEYEVEQ